MILFLAVDPKIEWLLKSQLLISRLLPDDINWDGINDSQRFNDAIHEKKLCTYIIDAPVMVMVK